jgi:hypothetical protein
MERFLMMSLKRNGKAGPGKVGLSSLVIQGCLLGALLPLSGEL